MYSYTYDESTGGLLLNSTPTNFSKEPRPVYAPELDMLGFDRYWEYDKQSDVPYMWAESSQYWYRGKAVAKIKGGDVFTAPEIILSTDELGNVILPEPANTPLKPIDIEEMIEKNRELMENIEEATVKKIIAIYEKYKNKLDIFHVAFSGGKDSSVLLDLVRRALPQRSFVVIFGDTGMEFPDTYDLVDKTRHLCDEQNIPFYTAKSHYTPTESWKLFGPPSQALRWCCSVHKSTPQTLKLREITNKPNCTCLDFVGVRAHESASRSEYEYENYGTKQKGQYSFNAILEWTSAEIWLYIYKNNLDINLAYKKGISRAGCLLCPMSSNPSVYARKMCYPEQIDAFINIITELNAWDEDSKIDSKTYITSRGWSARKSGRGLKGNELHYRESTKDGVITMELINPSSNWKEWLKTIESLDFTYTVDETKTGYKIHIAESAIKANPKQGKIFRQVLKKGAYCTGCRVCETNCRYGNLHFVNGIIEITNCVHCLDCHAIHSGCLMYASRKIPSGEKKMKTVNCFDDHAPKYDWLVEFFNNKDTFLGTEADGGGNSLGPNQLNHFKRYLRDAGLIDKNHCLPFATLIESLGWETDTAQALILVNLVNDNAQFEWYVKNLDLGIYYERDRVKDLLLYEDLKEKAANSVAKAYARLVDAPLGKTLLFGYVTDNQELVRTKCSISDNRVVLYSLLRFAEKCNDFKEFTLSWLMNDSIERDGISPTRIFGLDYEEAKSILMGLSAQYPEFIDATFTNDLDKITIKDKTSADVLKLFEEQ